MKMKKMKIMMKKMMKMKKSQNRMGLLGPRVADRNLHSPRAIFQGRNLSHGDHFVQDKSSHMPGW